MLLNVDNVSKSFHLPGGEILHAVRDISFSLDMGQTLGIVGESGSGKSTLARLVLRLHEADAGEITFDDTIDVRKANGKQLQQLRSRMQVIFQDPYSSLLPHYSATDNVAEPLRLHKKGNKRERTDRARELLSLVGIGSSQMNRLPNEFSGGQQQRIAIARALALEPELLVCDEPTSSLDVSIQAQIINLLADLQSRLGLSMLFISHNLAVVEHLATDVAVMYQGRMLEYAPAKTLFSDARHSYTKRLLRAVLPATHDAVEQEEEHIETPPIVLKENARELGELVEVGPRHLVAMMEGTSNQSFETA